MNRGIGSANLKVSVWLILARRGVRSTCSTARRSDSGLFRPEARAFLVGWRTLPTLIVERDGVLYVNPGSCGPRRFNLPISVGELRVSDVALEARTVDLL